ncbi:hypothetical protein E2C01_101107 [Portunus trituberculatus]|uniref:Uncharacterized protein n=1 Tax=Portunus trituberculatus TaxID=210409 RepID=A0A5B7KJ81_PORTR|nr:hypothetical protein [Portunus trituberculatus]
MRAKTGRSSEKILPLYRARTSALRSDSRSGRRGR